jgi:DNA-binding NtrC family response regulator
LIVHPSGERRWRRVEFWPFHNEKSVVTALLGLLRPCDEVPLAIDSEGNRLRVELMEARDRLIARHGTDVLVGRGAAHRRLLAQAAAAASTSAPVLIVGEPGTGKRHLARLIHQLGLGQNSTLLPLDCRALPPEALERELFGRMTESAPGASPLGFSEGTTLLLSAVLELPRDLQARLAFALERPTRLIGLTSRDPEAALRSDQLRPDFYYAITALVIRLAPLRERLDELPLLSQHFLEKANLRGGRQRGGFTEAALDTLMRYDWPCNLTELVRVIDDSHNRGGGDLIEAEHLPSGIQGHLASAYNPPPVLSSNTPLDELMTQVERRLIESALKRARNNKSRASEILGISRPRLYRRIKELGFPDEPEPTDELSAAEGQAGCSRETRTLRYRSLD